VAKDALASEAAAWGERILKASRETIGEVIPSTDVGYAAFVANNDNFCSPSDSQTIFAAGRCGPTGSSLREDDFANAATVTNAVTDTREYACHLSILGSKDALAREKHLKEDNPQESGSRDAAEHSQKENQRRTEDTEVVQQITCSAEPAQKGRDGKAVDGGKTRAVMRDSGPGMANVEMADVQMGEASDNREKAKDETSAEADEIEGVHIIWCSV
jgi:hypothetical protein